MRIDCTGWLVLDLECNMLSESQVRGGFYKRASRMLCVVTKDVITGEVKTFKAGEENALFPHLLGSPRLIGHNIRGFDAPALGNIYPEYNKLLRGHPMIDTLIQSRKDFDTRALSTFDKSKGYPSLKGLHSLEAWGYRFNSNKLKPMGGKVDWENVECSEEMIEYCKQDVHVTSLLFDHLMKKRGYEISKL